MKTNAARFLDEQRIAYQLHEYDVDPNDLSAETVAAKLGLPAEQVFKTLVARGDRTGVLMAVIAGNAELDRKALARLAGDRSIELVPLKEVQPLTGFLRGGVTAIGTRKDYPIFLDEAALTHEIISVSAGVRGTQIILNPHDYVSAVGATTGCFSKAK